MSGNVYLGGRGVYSPGMYPVLRAALGESTQLLFNEVRPGHYLDAGRAEDFADQHAAVHTRFRRSHSMTSVSKPPRLIVFLDVDGVLHPFSAVSLFHAPCMAALRSVIEQTGASIILSSSWQGTASSRGQLDSALQANGIPSCVGRTCADSKTGASETCRAAEIKRWVSLHPELCADGWVAIDDLDLQRFLPDRFVRTSAEDGLTQVHGVVVRSLLYAHARTHPLIHHSPMSMSTVLGRVHMLSLSLTHKARPE